MTDSQCVDYLENICKMFVNGSKNCEGQALEYQLCRSVVEWCSIKYEAVSFKSLIQEHYWELAMKGDNNG